MSHEPPDPFDRSKDACPSCSDLAAKLAEARKSYGADEILALTTELLNLRGLCAEQAERIAGLEKALAEIAGMTGGIHDYEWAEIARAALTPAPAVKAEEPCASCLGEKGWWEGPSGLWHPCPKCAPKAEEKEPDDRCGVCRMEYDDCGCPEDDPRCWPAPASPSPSGGKKL